ncbi:MAG: hypothetical protein HY814_15360 [Candidatus Riflebacteria bacterium]|nr:hypothetical protein [Candidatus Riflebacteria bacterium]
MNLLDNLTRSSSVYEVLARLVAGTLEGHAFLVHADSLPVARHFARYVARGLACRGEGQRPCGECHVCLRPAPPHLRHIVPMGVEIRIGQIHALLEECSLSLDPGARRVYLLDGAESMNDESANAFLKVLEEPPPAVAFILAAGSLQQVLPTIRSRCRLLPVDFPSTRRLLEGPLASSPAHPHWLYAALETWGRHPQLLQGTLTDGAPVAPGFPPSSTGDDALQSLLGHHRKRPARELADPAEGLFADLAYTFDSTSFFLGVLARVLEGGTALAALEESKRMTAWLEHLREAVGKGLHAYEAELRKTAGPAYVHPLLEEDSYERSFLRSTGLVALDAYFRTALLVASAALTRCGGADGRWLAALAREAAPVRIAAERGPDWAGMLAAGVESARAQLRAAVTPRYVLEAFHLSLAGCVPSSRSSAWARTDRFA